MNRRRLVLHDSFFGVSKQRSDVARGNAVVTAFFSNSNTRQHCLAFHTAAVGGDNNGPPMPTFIN